MMISVSIIVSTFAEATFKKQLSSTVVAPFRWQVFVLCPYEFPGAFAGVED